MKKIMLVDDDICLTEALKMLLADEGYEVVIVNDERNLEDKISLEKPDVVILDYRLVLDNGINVAQKIRKNPDISNVPIIMISASNNVAGLIKDNGINAFLAKPFEIDTLLKVVSKCTHLI